MGFAKAVPQAGWFKLGLYGPTGSGKTLTSLLLAEGLARRSGKRIAYIDTEHSTKFYDREVPERTVHPGAFDFDRIDTRSMFDALAAVESLDPNVYGVLVIDSITHLWDAAKESYQGKKTSKGGIPVQAWGDIKRPYKRMMSLFLDGAFDAIVCGREGVQMEDDENGEPVVTGKKMKAEGETPYEPDVLGHMRPRREDDGSHIISVFFEKDRSSILEGRSFDWPTFATIERSVAILAGGGKIEGKKLGTPEENAAHDAAAREQQAEQAEADRKALSDQIRKALIEATDITTLQAAWSLTKGKKTKLGEESYADLEALKNNRKNDILKAVA